MQPGTNRTLRKNRALLWYTGTSVGDTQHRMAENHNISGNTPTSDTNADALFN